MIYNIIPSGNEGEVSEKVQCRPCVKIYLGGVLEFVIDRVSKDKLSIKESRSK